MDDQAPPQNIEGDLAIRLMTGDDAAFREFIRLYGGRVRGHLECKCGKRKDLADEAFGLALTNVWKYAIDYDESKGSLGSWFLRIAQNALIDLARKDKRRRHDQLTEESSIDKGERPIADDVDPKKAKAAARRREQRHEAVREITGSLPPRQQEIMRADAAHPDGQVPVTDLAVWLETSEGAVKTARSKARSTLRKEMIRRGFYPTDQR